MSRYETPPRTREKVCRLQAKPCTSSGGISVRFRACISGSDLGELVVERHTLLKEVAPSLRACLTSRSLFQISLVRGDAVFEQAGLGEGGGQAMLDREKGWCCFFVSQASSRPFWEAIDGDEYGVLMQATTDGDFLGLNGPSDSVVRISFRWAVSGEKIAVREMKECSTMSDVNRELREMMPGFGLVKLVLGDTVYAKAGGSACCMNVWNFFCPCAMSCMSVLTRPAADRSSLPPTTRSLG